MAHWSEGYTPKPTEAKAPAAFLMQGGAHKEAHLAYWNDLNAETLAKTATDRSLSDKIYRDRFGEAPKAAAAPAPEPAPAAAPQPEPAAAPEPAPEPAPAPKPAADAPITTPYSEPEKSSNTLLYAGIAVVVLIVLYFLLG